jgi:hypothetical protein
LYLVREQVYNITLGFATRAEGVCSTHEYKESPGVDVVLIGYNTNVTYKGQTYHVQTEDNGRHSPFIITLLYLQGAILGSRKTNYAHILDLPDFEERLRTLMKEQHKAMIKELLAGGKTASEEARPSGSQEGYPVMISQSEKSSTAGNKTESTGGTCGGPATGPSDAVHEGGMGDESRSADRTRSLDEIILDCLSKRMKE